MSIASIAGRGTMPDERATVLVATPDAALAQAVAAAFAAHGVTVRGAADGLGALAQLQLEVPDAIDVDLGLSSMSGPRLVDLLKRDPGVRDVPVLALAWSFEEANETLRQGVEDYLSQPAAPRRSSAASWICWSGAPAAARRTRPGARPKHLLPESHQERIEAALPALVVAGFARLVSVTRIAGT